MAALGFSATLVSYNYAFIRHPHSNLDSFFLLECLHLYLVKIFWNAQLLDTGAPIARDWVVTALGFSATSVSYNYAFIRHPHSNLDSFFLLECLHLYLVKIFWNAQLLDTGAPIARDWVVTALGFSAKSVSYNYAFIRHPHSHLNLIFLLECFHLQLVKIFWNAQLLDTGAPIARDWVVTALGFSTTLAISMIPVTDVQMVG